jgi:hypothetical protein
MRQLSGIEQRIRRVAERVVPQRPIQWLGKSKTERTAGLRWSVLLTLAIAGVVWGIHYIYRQTNEATGDAPDASVLIATFITLYSAFIAGFLVLASFVVSRKRHLRLRFIAVWFLVAATAVDLWRVLNAANDLYHNLVGSHTKHALLDYLHDFRIYFVLNIFITAFVIVVAVQGGNRASQPTTAGSGPAAQSGQEAGDKRAYPGIDQF